MPDQASLGLLGDDTSSIGYTLLDSETDTPRRGVREAIILALLLIIAVMSTVLAVVYSANSEALAVFVSVAVVFALAFVGVAIRYAASLRANAVPAEEQQQGASPERSHQPAQEVAQQPGSTPDEAPHRGEAASDDDIAPPRSGSVSQPTTTAPSGIETSPSAADLDRYRSTSQPTAPSPRDDIAPPRSGSVSQPTTTAPSGIETSPSAGAELTRSRSTSQSVAPSSRVANPNRYRSTSQPTAPSPRDDIAPPRSGSVSQPTTTAPSGIETSPSAGAELTRSRSTSQSVAPSSRVANPNRYRSTSQPTAPSPRDDIAPPRSGSVSQPTTTAPSGIETSPSAGAELTRSRSTSQSVAPSSRVANPNRYRSTSQPTAPSPRDDTEFVRYRSTSYPMVPSPGASAASAEGLQQDALHRLTQEIARQLRSTPGTASRRDDIYAQEEDVALAAGSSTDADCVFIRLSPVEWSLLRDNREVAHIREILDGGQAIEAPRLFHCDNKLHVLARDGAIFRIDSASIVPAEYLDSAATLGDA
ncbi:hypothetical protein GH714_042668 [Hevea brasiliensis]|uniref:Uncharacterized protein n=1 Tax=Hevea brasiliensis TaxID=3981 RepID=A0A6A6K035_HEVBR|nr:hypothetical protein GH714_042668 [Hevea brasiliensis]